MKKLGIVCFTVLMYFANCICSFAAELRDIPDSHWAYPEINAMVESGLMTTNSRNEFKPDDPIKRTDFVAILLRVCDFKNTPIARSPYFKDLKDSTRNLEEILTAQQLRIIFGYPDKTFKPEIPTKRAEATSAIAHVVNSDYSDPRILNGFTDQDKIPDWAIDSYIQTAANELFVNYPNPRMLEPNKNITRAQSAVLLVKVYNYTKNKMLVREGSSDKVAQKPPVEDNRIKEVFIKNETLSLYPDAPRNIVEIYNTKIVIGAGNVLIGSFANDFSSKTTSVGDTVRLVARHDVSTNEGRLLYPAGTAFSGKVDRVKLSIWRDKKDKALLVLDKATPPRGGVHDMAGVPLTTENGVVIATHGKDKKEKLYVNYKRSDKELSKTEFLVNFANKVSPRVKYNHKADDEIYILLTGDMIINLIDPKNVRKDVL